MGTLALVAACGGSSTSVKRGQAVVFDTFDAFSGPNADFGTTEYSGCPPAVLLINQAGGILGHRAVCKATDTRGDPADAVLAGHQLLASTPNLVGVLGPSSLDDTATMPLFEGSKIPAFDDGGSIAFNKNQYAYFWRTTPADNVEGFAMAVWARERGYTRAAGMFLNDVSAQGNVPGVVSGYPRVGGRLVINESLTTGQTSYATELQRMMSSHPQVMFTETDPPTAAVLWRELKQDGALLPIIGTIGQTGPDFQKAVTSAVGTADLNKYYVLMEPYSIPGPATQVFARAMAESAKQVPSYAKSDDGSNPIQNAYDDVNIMALAMVAAHSVTPAVYNTYIESVVQPGKGKVVVSTYAAGKKALEAGKKIRYVGAIGPITFNRYHNSTGVFAAVIPSEGYRQTGSLVSTGTLAKVMAGTTSG